MNSINMIHMSSDEPLRCCYYLVRTLFALSSRTKCLFALWCINITWTPLIFWHFCMAWLHQLLINIICSTEMIQEIFRHTNTLKLKIKLLLTQAKVWQSFFYYQQNSTFPKVEHATILVSFQQLCYLNTENTLGSFVTGLIFNLN